MENKKPAARTQSSSVEGKVKSKRPPSASISPAIAKMINSLQDQPVFSKNRRNSLTTQEDEQSTSSVTKPETVDYKQSPERKTSDYGTSLDENVNFYGERKDDDRRIVLVGRTGSGKSATGNTLLQEYAFESKSFASSITKNCARETKTIFERRVLVIDTPGLFDTKLSNKQISQEIIQCVTMSSPGPHVFLLVIGISRFTKEEIDTFASLFDIFGEQMSDFSIIVLTRSDDLEHDGTSVEEYISSNIELKKLAQKVGNRYIALNNRANEKTLQSKALLKLVDKVVAKNKGRCYTNELYKVAEENLRSRILKVEREKAEEKNREIKKIEERFVLQINQANKSNEGLQKMIEKQQYEKNVMENTQKQAEVELQRLRDEIKSINAVHEKELFDLTQKRKNEAEKELSTMEQKQHDLEERIKQLDKQSEEVMRQRAELTNWKQTELQTIRETHESKMKDAVQNILESKFDLASLEQKMASAREEINSLKQENKQLKEGLEKADSRLLEEVQKITEGLTKLTPKEEEGSSCSIM